MNGSQNSSDFLLSMTALQVIHFWLHEQPSSGLLWHRHFLPVMEGYPMYNLLVTFDQQKKEKKVAIICKKCAEQSFTHAFCPLCTHCKRTPHIYTDTGTQGLLQAHWTLRLHASQTEICSNWFRFLWALVLPGNRALYSCICLGSSWISKG